MSEIIVLGSNFAGLTAALETARRAAKLKVKYRITVISPSQNFLYVPSLIWVPFGQRQIEDITFPVSPVLKKRGIEFIHDKAIKVIADKNIVATEKTGEISYDYLVVSTGVDLQFDTIPGFNKDYTECIVTPKQALKSYTAFKKLLDNPGPVVVGATQGASCMGAAYEYLFNMEKQLRKHKIKEKAPMTWITPEPELGHFGIGGIKGGRPMLEAFMKMFKIKWHVNCIIEEVQKDRIVLKDGTQLPFNMAMLIPPFTGAEAMRNSTELVDEKGFVVCDDSYQHVKYKNIFAAGLAVQVVSPFPKTAAPYGIPKTGFPSEVQGKIVAQNITSALKGETKRKSLKFGRIPAICIMDAGDKEVFILASHLFRPRIFEFIIPNVLFNFGKRLLEWYMIYKNKKGWAFLP